MLILHLSDIHFQFPACATPQSDVYKPFRTRLLQDARTRVAQLGSVDAILVGGDIAFAGKPQEYVAALDWLKDLAVACSCQLAQIYVIPGNHDVDQKIIIDNLQVQNAQGAIISATDKEKELAKQLAHKETRPALLLPLSAYNEFAAPLSCQVFSPEQLFWSEEMPLSEDVQLRIFGLTSTILSGAGAPNHKKDKPRDLYLSPQQTVLNPEDNVVNLVMCHHPPDWFMDQDKVEDDIKGRASIHLFGHKHRQRIHRDPRYVTFFAGAVNPNIHEPEWKPGYNIIRLTLGQDKNGDSCLKVEGHLLEWQNSPELFKPILDDDQGNSEIHYAEVRLRNITIKAKEAGKTVPPTPRIEKVNSEVAMVEEPAKNIVLRFWNLSLSQRREIAVKLHLLEKDEMGLPQSEKYGRALLRA